MTSRFIHPKDLIARPLSGSPNCVMVLSCACLSIAAVGTIFNVFSFGRGVGPRYEPIASPTTRGYATSWGLNFDYLLMVSIVAQIRVLDASIGNTFLGCLQFFRTQNLTTTKIILFLNEIVAAVNVRKEIVAFTILRKVVIFKSKAIFRSSCFYKKR